MANLKEIITATLIALTPACSLIKGNTISSLDQLPSFYAPKLDNCVRGIDERTTFGGRLLLDRQEFAVCDLNRDGIPDAIDYMETAMRYSDWRSVRIYTNPKGAITKIEEGPTTYGEKGFLMDQTTCTAFPRWEPQDGSNCEIYAKYPRLKPTNFLCGDELPEEKLAVVETLRDKLFPIFNSQPKN